MTKKWWPFGRKESAAPASAYQPRSYGPNVPQQQWMAVIDQPVDRHRITVSQLKGGVGKSTTVAGLGTALATYRRDTTVAIDVNPHRGTLAERIGVEHSLTVADLLANIENVREASDFRRYTSQSASRFEVLACEKDPEKAKLLTPEEFDAAMEAAATFRTTLLVDTGTDMTTDLMSAVYAATDTLVVPAPAAADGFALAKETLDWWERKAPNGPQLVAEAVVVFIRNEGFSLDPANMPSPERLEEELHAWEAVQVRREQHLISQMAGRVRSVVTVPYDPQLRTGHMITWEGLQPNTRDAFINVAYEVAKAFKPAVGGAAPAAPLNAIAAVYDVPRHAAAPTTGEQSPSPARAAAPQHSQQPNQQWQHQSPPAAPQHQATPSHPRHVASNGAPWPQQQPTGAWHNGAPHAAQPTQWPPQ